MKRNNGPRGLQRLPGESTRALLLRAGLKPWLFSEGLISKFGDFIDNEYDPDWSPSRLRAEMARFTRGGNN